jgi:hypothetical protein
LRKHLLKQHVPAEFLELGALDPLQAEQVNVHERQVLQRDGEVLWEPAQVAYKRTRSKWEMGCRQGLKAFYRAH